TPSHLVLLNPSFLRPDRSTLSLTKSEPIQGVSFADQNPDGSELVLNEKQKKAAKKLKHYVTTPVASDPLIYVVPNGVVRFTCKASTSQSSPDGSIDVFLSVNAPDEASPTQSPTPRHATPNASVIVPHLAAQSLVKLQAVEDCLQAIGTPTGDLALWALSRLHTEEAVDGLLQKLASASDTELRSSLLTTLGRLYYQEAPYDGTWWWTTRPDTRGPYYKPITWEASERIALALATEAQEASGSRKSFLADLNDSHRLGMDDTLGTNLIAEEEEEQPTVDLTKIASQKGAIATTPIEDILLSLDTLIGDPQHGEKLFTQQGCIACHALAPGGPALGPYMGQIGSIMSPEQIATAILRPNDTISQGFQTAQLTLKDGTQQIGFVTESNSDMLKLRNMLGQVSTVKTADIEEEVHLPNSMMPAGLANALSLQEFASMVSYLAGKK
ncbi:MAG: hypothetical protein AAGJ31_10345, partial [Verrucomicrobiota bacterium]